MYLSEVLKFPKDKKVYVFGHEGIEEELDEVGIAHIGGSVSIFTLFQKPPNSDLP